MFVMARNPALLSLPVGKLSKRLCKNLFIKMWLPSAERNLSWTTHRAFPWLFLQEIMCISRSENFSMYLEITKYCWAIFFKIRYLLLLEMTFHEQETKDAQARTAKPETFNSPLTRVKHCMTSAALTFLGPQIRGAQPLKTWTLAWSLKEQQPNR